MDRPGVPVATNSWARRTILARAIELGLPPDVAKQVGSLAIWYYNRIVAVVNRKDSLSQELPRDTNRYLVPITLAMASANKKHPVDLERILRLSGTPTQKTIDTAHQLLAGYDRLLARARRTTAPPRSARPPAPTRGHSAAQPGDAPEFQLRPEATARPASASLPRSPTVRPAPIEPTMPPATGLAMPPTAEVLQLRRLFGIAQPTMGGPKPPPRPRQQNTNAWARKRIADLCRSQGIPDRVRT
ncbi:MAG: hypothetical protein L3J91_05600, partial [Thermoplasmata archaeon]|nr:hypothetical protein [Thermoplasmata archaeon]